MKKIAILLSFFTVWGSVTNVNAQDLNEENTSKNKIYEVNMAVDLPVTIAGSLLTLYGFDKIRKKTPPTLDMVNSLDYEQSVSKFNRFFMSEPNYSGRAGVTSDYLFYGAFPVGFGLLVDEKIRSDFGTIALMYWETLAITGAIYATTAANVNKFRPQVYPGAGAPESDRLRYGALNSFPGGHPTITAAATFFTAKVIQDYYPNRKGLHIAAYSGAAALTLTNAVLRHEAGKHFASDLLVGLAYSVPIGILVPQLHKIAKNNDRVAIYNSLGGMTIAYTIE